MSVVGLLQPVYFEKLSPVWVKEIASWSSPPTTGSQRQLTVAS